MDKLKQVKGWIIGITDKYSGYRHSDGTHRKYPTEFTWYRWRFQVNSIKVLRFRVVWWNYGMQTNFQFKYASKKGNIIGMQETRWLNLGFNFQKGYKHIYLDTI